MSLSLAFSTARSSLMATATQIEASTRNVGNAGDPNSSRKIAVTTTMGSGGAYVVQISRASDTALYTRMVSATSDTARAQAMQGGLDQLQSLVGDPTSAQSAAALLGTFTSSLSNYRNSPEEGSVGTALVVAAKNLTSALNSAAAGVNTVRQDADEAMAESVTRVNDLLRQFGEQNEAVVRGTNSGADVTDALDKRDAILSQLSEEMGISTVTRPGNDMVIYTDSGATLFETTARTVTFQPTSNYSAGVTGKSVYVDGVAVAGPDATMTLKSGNLAGLAELRDQTSLTYQNQIDEIARALVGSFMESDPTGTLPDAQGLFTATNLSDPGAAARLTVNAAVDPSQGGSATLIRDGGINGTAYVQNAEGGESYSGWLASLSTNLSAGRTFSTAGGIPTSATLADYSTSSVGWLSGQRQSWTTEATSQSSLLAHASTALSNATGINLDDEYVYQLELEKTYQASSKLLSIVNQLYDTLLEITR
ncbi:flagellar hook-associated protein FlgK [Aquabacter cavernae]|uniref:flagellar hook-associated protein FlgK n=1 Tax=Aquabacter cavernae TaxID=2496029 RepID=UPI000F8F03A8|nr:flagellar hook-associated protein FlgK [Aquabacter cavernae]